MKRKILSIVICLALFAALLPTGWLAATVSADTLYKTENVTVPEGWDYVEVSTAEELYEALEKHKNSENNYHPQPIFIRLMADIEHSGNDLAKLDDSLVEAYIYTTTTFDLNGHHITMDLNESKDADNHTWYLLNLSLICDEGEDLTFRIVDSVGGGFFNLWANTYVDGPTTTVRIWSNNKAKVIIDGGVFKLFTNNTKAVGLSVIEGYGSVRDSGGYPLWTQNQYFRSALALDNVDATINDGHFVAKCQIEDGLHGKTIRRFVSALGLDNSATGMLQVNGGLFEGDAFAVYNYTWVDSDLAHAVKFPTLNGGTFKGGIMLISGEGMATWKNIFGYDLNSTNKKLPISTVLHEGARMFIDGAALRANPDTTTLEDIAWPHDITVQSGPMIVAEKANGTDFPAGVKPSIYLEYNKTPDSIEIQELYTVGKAGKIISQTWEKLEGANYYKLPASAEYDYWAEIPSRTHDGSRTVRVAAKFGDITVYSDEYRFEFFQSFAYAFTAQPTVTPKGEDECRVSFTINYPNMLDNISLWKDVNGDHYTLIDKSRYNTIIPASFSEGNYSIEFTDLYGAKASEDEATYMIRAEYDNRAGGTTGVDSVQFTVTRDDLEHHHVYPEGWNYEGEEVHGRVCMICGGGLIDFEAHYSSAPATVEHAEVCDACGHVMNPALDSEPSATYTLSFHGNGAEGEMASIIDVEGSTISLPGCDFTPPAGKHFKGWAYSGSSVDAEIITEVLLTDNITVYAIWESDNPTGGASLVSIEVTKPANITKYVEGRPFNPEGMEITATYSDKHTAVVTGYTVSKENLKFGDTFVLLTYTEGDVTLTMEVGVTVLPYEIDVEREDIPLTGTAYERKQEVEIDGQKITMPAYALKDSKGYPTNYVRLRDLAALLNGTAAQFDVLWSAGTVTVLPKTPYDHPNGTEGNIPFSGNQPYAAYLEDTYIGNNPAPLTAFRIEYQGGGHTYYKLRDLGKALGFNVGWSTERGIFIETDKPYDPAD